MKSKISIFLVICTICAICTTAFVKGKDQITPLQIPMIGAEIPDIEFTLSDNTLKSSNVSEDPKMVYKFTSDNSENESKKIAKIFNISDLQLDVKDNKYKSIKKTNNNKNVSKLFTYDKENGHWEYQDLDELSMNDNINSISSIPSNEECIKIAKTFIKEKVNIPNKFTNITVVEQTSGDNTTNDLKTLYKDVYFYPVINGNPVLGVSRFIVSIGNQGKIVSVNKYFKDYKEDKKLKIKSAKKAFELVKNKKASINISQNAEKATFDKVILTYYEDPGTIAEQPYLQPVYVFSGKSTSASEEEKEFDAIVPALEE